MSKSSLELSKNVETKILKVSELSRDSNNANKGTERGNSLLRDSISDYGLGRSILIDKHGRIIAGNKTTEGASSLGIDDVLVIPSDGSKLIAVQRMDLDLEKDKEARELAYADNRISEVDLSWDIGVLERDKSLGIDIGKFFSDEEQEVLFSKVVELSDYSESSEDCEYDSSSSIEEQYYLRVELNSRFECEELSKELNGRGYVCKY